MVKRLTKKKEIDWFEEKMKLKSINIDNFDEKDIRSKINFDNKNFNEKNYEDFIFEYIKDSDENISIPKLIIEENIKFPNH